MLAQRVAYSALLCILDPAYVSAVSKTLRLLMRYYGFGCEFFSTMEAYGFVSNSEAVPHEVQR